MEQNKRNINKLTMLGMMTALVFVSNYLRVTMPIAIGGQTSFTLGVVLPSLIIISILAGLITNFSYLAWVQNAFAAIQVCVCVLIFNAVLKLLKKSVIDKRTTVIFLLVAAGSLFLTISPVWFVLLAAIAGLVLKNLEERAAK